MTIASIPKSNDIQEPSSTVKPVTSPNDTNSNNDDDEVDTNAPRTSVASRFMNALLSPTLRQSTGNNAGDLKRPAEVTPVPTSTTITSKRSRHVTVTPKRIGESATEPVSANDNSKSRVKRKVKDPTNLYRDVYNLLEESTAKHPELIRWTDDGKGFFCDGSDKVKLTKWLGNFGLPKWESFRRRLNIYGFRKEGPVKNNFFMHDLFHRGLKEADLNRLHKLHLDGASKRSKAKAAVKKTKAVVSKPTRVTTTMVITASKKTLKKSPVRVKKMDSAAVKPKASEVNEAFEQSEAATTPLKFTTEVVAQRNDSVSITTPVAVKRPTSYSPGDFPPLPLSALMDAAVGHPQSGSLPFDSEVESTAAVDTSSPPLGELMDAAVGHPQSGSLPFDSEVESTAAVGTSSPRLSALMDAALGYPRTDSLPFDSEDESTAAVGTSSPPLSELMDAAIGYPRTGSLPFDSEVESNAAVGPSFTKQVSSAPFVSPTGHIQVEWSSLPLATLAELGYPQSGSLPFDSEVESDVAMSTFFTDQASSALFVSSTGYIPVAWSSLPLATLADTALGMDLYEKSLSLDALVSPCKSTKKSSAVVGPTLDYTTLFAQDSVASPAAGFLLLANPTHTQGVPMKMSFANGVSAFATSPVDAVVLTATDDVDVSGRLTSMESVQAPSTPPVSAASFTYCPATPVKWSGEQLSAFSPISIPARKDGPSPPGTAFESSLVNMPSDALSLRLGELANLSDDELLVGQVEAV